MVLQANLLVGMRIKSSYRGKNIATKIVSLTNRATIFLLCANDSSLGGKKFQNAYYCAMKSSIIWYNSYLFPRFFLK